MSLASGTRLGPYEIQSAIGAGGMGEVYKARDTRLDRTVAIKVLPPDVSGDPGRRARFEREAKTIAGLNHPHICVLHDVGDHEGSMFLVMEHLAGQTLAERLVKGPLPLEQALTIATEIADALSAAHRQGVIHRDLKPGNVMLTKGGAKLLDFGLAKLAGHGEQPAATYAVSAAPTQAPTLTGPGVIVGTLQYMAPEQLEGKPADARADLWALGAILYEMLTGKRAFEGTSAVNLMGAIMEREPPPIASLQPPTPVGLQRLVSKCLRKDPEQRWQSAADVADECRWLSQNTPAASAGPRPPGLRGARTAVWVAAVALAAAVGAAASWRLTASVPAPTHVTLSLAAEGVAPAQDVAVSPDGRTIVFSSMEGATRRLFARRLDRWECRVLPNTEGAAGPSFSPDGRWVAFSSPRGLQRVDLTGGPALPVYSAGGTARLASGSMTAWDSAGNVIFSRFGPAASGLWRVAAGGGKPELLVRSENTSTRYLHPQVLPGDRALLFTVYAGGRASIAALSLESGKVKTVWEHGSRGRYLPASGLLLFQADGSLFGLPFDPSKLEARGELRVVAEGVGNSDVLWSEYDVSPAGTLAFLPRSDVRISWIDRKGAVQPVGVEKLAQSGWVAISPDGRTAIVALAKGHVRQVYRASLEGDLALTRLTPGDDDYYGVFTPDSSRILFTAPGEAGGYNIFSMRADGSGTPRRETRAASWQSASSVRRDAGGEIFLFHDLPGGPGGSAIWQQRLGVPGSATRLVGEDARSAQFSPDGHWVAYASTESGREEIYVRGYPDGAKNQVSPDGGANPRWNPKGGELFYESATSVFSVRIHNGARLGGPQRLFARTAYGARNWDVAPDGQRFLVAESTRPAAINVITNWFEELKAKVPAAK